MIQRNLLVPFSGQNPFLKMEAACSLNYTRYHNTEDHNPHIHSHENLKSHVRENCALNLICAKVKDVKPPTGPKLELRTS
jgi:hypothetical protein